MGTVSVQHTDHSNRILKQTDKDAAIGDWRFLQQIAGTKCEIGGWSKYMGNNWVKQVSG